MELELLLRYQSLDRELFLMEKRFRESPEVERYAVLQARLKEYFQVILKLDKESEELFESFRKKRETTDASVDGAGRIMQSYDGEGNLERLDALEEDLSKLEKALSSGEKDCVQTERRLLTILENYEKYYGAAADVNKKLKDATKNREEKRAEMLRSAEPVQAELKKIRDQIPSEVMQAYQEVRKRKIMPVLVPYYSEGGSCGGCGMEIVREIGDAFDRNGLAECPNCGRILYKE